MNRNEIKGNTGKAKSKKSDIFITFQIFNIIFIFINLGFKNIYLIIISMIIAISGFIIAFKKQNNFFSGINIFFLLIEIIIFILTLNKMI